MPFYPDDVKPITEPQGNALDSAPTEANLDKLDKSDTENLIDGRPKWYDPIFTEMFIELKLKFEERFKP